MPVDNRVRATPTRPSGSENTAALDDALKNTFPASDAVSMLQPTIRDRDRPVVESETEARQGVTGHNVRYVLGWGLAGVVVAFVVVYLLYNA
jgi:hypothetical protein